MPALKLSGARPRAELIAAYAYGQTVPLAVAPPPPANAAPPVDAPAVDPAAADDAVTKAIATLKADLAAAQAAQKADPDHADPKDEKVAAGLDAIAQAIAELEQDQAADAAGETTETPPATKTVPRAAPAPAKPSVTAAAPVSAAPQGSAKLPQTNPVDVDGNVDGKAVCANPDCQHLASAHLNDDQAGQNTGACQMTNCSCLGMAVESAPNTGGDDQPSSGDGSQPGADSQELALAPPMPVPTPPGSAKTDAPDLNAPPAVPGSENMGPAFTIPVGVIEGQPTGDGRQIAPDALTWRSPPMPLMGLATDTHDPMGIDQNDPAVICGRIDSIERAPGQGDTQVIIAKGFYLPNDDGAYYAALTEAMGRCGISADIAVQETDITSEGLDDDGWPVDMTEVTTAGTVMGFTQLPFPAFAGAYIVLGDGSQKPAAVAIPQQADAEPVTASIHYLTYEQCERCEQGAEVIVAAGAGPSAPPAAWFEDPHFTEGDGRLSEILDRRGQRAIGGKFACPLTITDDGRVYGHLAPWGVCHIGKPGCVTAPQSKSDYAYFKRGQHVICADGSKVRVGSLTVNVGHADVRAGSAAAMAHYDNIATIAADVNAGEDEYGIWIAGAVRPTATPQQIAALRASSISGDWRGLGGSLELVAALAVPVPGFPHAIVVGAQEEMLVASGAMVMHRLKHPVEPVIEEGDVSLRRALAPLLKLSRDSARARMSGLRG
jgi:hypothetical protein